ncbi:uncharacterized protein KY384_007696 [Bacidia gigantensis]|uniref:uncharacterized protein n=1 Tax=Bacidia gigantensis TaxID=2732470 RepID=UPI001D05A525|nr:uncharacterized protein KY384_007696 [Bacidia gigantensis]KAG8527544.1 hypothetical protein KY384_007696 [Bacidia gigantensis]
MGRRPLSPVGSENGLDITASLSHYDVPKDSKNAVDLKSSGKQQVENGTFDLEGSESDDADFIAGSLAAANRKSSHLKGKTVKKGGGFQAMGLSANLLKAISKKGFSVPTPIQRKTIPIILDGRDVVGMARTGSGKTAAFVVPMIEKLKSHSAKVGARALVLSPSRELALQTLKVVKALGGGTDLKSILLVGGDSLEEQFGSMSSNPDVVIATPGRFLHLKVEMGLDLSSVRYVVFDEADRLFEMGFATQLIEILHALPQSRQTLLFSATLPKSLVEFARAGLQEPTLIRLDAESKISSDLQSAFFTMKSADKEGALLHILHDVIKMPTGAPNDVRIEDIKPSKNTKKRKRGKSEATDQHEAPSEHSTIIFTATKHHVEYVAALLRESGFAVSIAYGSLDQTARKMQVQDFRTGTTDILVVTDVAARGIDIPVLANVVNYDFPAQSKIFVHRVGRTARAGQKGWSFSLIQTSEAPYLLDLQLFLGKRLVLGTENRTVPSYSDDVVIGSLAKHKLESNCEWVTKLLDEQSDLRALRSVALRGEKLYLRSRPAASAESARRAKTMASSKPWSALHPLFFDHTDDGEAERAEMIARVSGFRPTETVFEIGRKGQKDAAAQIMRRRRATVGTHQSRKQDSIPSVDPEALSDNEKRSSSVQLSRDIDAAEQSPDSVIDVDTGSASEDDLQVTISNTYTSRHSKSTNSDPQSDFFMAYTPTSTNLAEDRAYAVQQPTSTGDVNNFLIAAQGATMDLVTDEGRGIGEPSRQKRWDKKAKKYVDVGNDRKGDRESKRFIRSESGQKIAASFRSGRFEAWKKANKVAKMPRVGEAETAFPKRLAGVRRGNFGSGKSFRHRSERAPMEADKYRDDFYKKRKKVEKAKEAGRAGTAINIGGRKGGDEGETRGTDAVRKLRKDKEKRREKTAGRHKKGRGRG